MSDSNRKLASEAAMEALGLPVFDGLEELSHEFHGVMRSPREVITRCLALAVVVAHALPGGALAEELDAQRLGVEAALTPAERAFLTAAEPGDEDRFHAATKMEAILVLMWALGVLEDMGPPVPSDSLYATLMVHVGQLADVEPDASLRGDEQVVDALDLYVRMALTITAMSEQGDDLPEGVDPVCVVVRAGALRWLVDRAADFDDTEIGLSRG
jgi:hypothetical protein